MSDLVSVVIPVHNREGTVEKAIRSALIQDADLEVVVVDDGSTDGTPATVVVIGDRRVRYARQQNAGSSAARVKGAAIASGDWLLFLDSDDYLEPNALATLLDCAARNPEAAFVFGSCWFEDTLTGIRAPAVDLPLGRGLDLARFVVVNSQCYNCRFLVRRAAYEAVGGYSPDIRVGAPELMVFVPLFLRFPFARVPDRVAVVCDGASGRLSRQSEKVLRGWEVVFERLCRQPDLREALAPVAELARATQWKAHGKVLYSQDQFRDAREAFWKALTIAPWTAWSARGNSAVYIVKSYVREWFRLPNERT